MLYLYAHLFNTLIYHQDKFESNPKYIKYNSSNFKAQNQCLVNIEIILKQCNFKKKTLYENNVYNVKNCTMWFKISPLVPFTTIWRYGNAMRDIDKKEVQMRA